MGRKTKGLIETAGLPKYHNISGIPVFLFHRHKYLGGKWQMKTEIKSIYRLVSLLFFVSVFITACGNSNSNPPQSTSSARIMALPLTLPTHYVDSAGFCGGQSPCYTTIQSAINDASAGDMIQVLAGEYTENISLKSGVMLQGAGAAATTLRGTGTGSVVTATGVDATTTIDGFTITGGNATSGGGIYNFNSSPTISNTIITGNSAALDGGGIYNLYNSSPTIINSILTGNNAGRDGGGIYYSIGGLTTIANTTVTGNNAGHNGGGIYLYLSSLLTINNSTISVNNADFTGGGIYINRTPTTISNSTISRNSAQAGGGVNNDTSSTTTIANTIISENKANYLGGGILSGIGFTTVSNSTITGNSASDGGGISCNNGIIAIQNSIITSNTGGGILKSLNSGVTSDYTDVWNNSSYDYSGLSAGTHDISADPKFVDAANSNYRLRPDSPCIDNGNNAAVPSSLTTDFYGSPRIADGNSDGSAIVDRGAVEYSAALTVAVTTPANDNAGRTIPVKFAIRVASNVDPLQPFVHNEGLEIQIYNAANPSVILQTSHYGISSINYRINDTGQFYITNFKTDKNPATYIVKITQTGLEIGEFTFMTVN